MIEFRLNDKEYKMPTCWEDITLKMYINLSKLEEIKSTFSIEELYLMRVLEVLVDVNIGELDEMSIDMMNSISTNIKFMQEVPEWKFVERININNIDYIFPHDLNKLTMGEYISIKTMQTDKGDIDFIPYLLAIILRPGKKILVENEERMIQEKFDVESMEQRRELFLSHPVIELMGPVSFFLNGNIKS